MPIPPDIERALNVSRETAQRLEIFVALLSKWQARINLIAPSTLPEVWTRHIADSAQLHGLAPQARTWVDLGSGGGFPGLVVAILGHDVPGRRVILVESNGKKCAFLREVIRSTGAPAEVRAVRIEDFIAKFDEAADIVSARALADLDQLLTLSFPLLKRGATGLFPKGQDVEVELTKASKSWNIRYQLIPSRTDRDARIVQVDSVSQRA